MDKNVKRRLISEELRELQILSEGGDVRLQRHPMGFSIGLSDLYVDLYDRAGEFIGTVRLHYPAWFKAEDFVWVQGPKRSVHEPRHEARDSQDIAPGL